MKTKPTFMRFTSEKKENKIRENMSENFTAKLARSRASGAY